MMKQSILSLMILLFGLGAAHSATLTYTPVEPTTLKRLTLESNEGATTGALRIETPSDSVTVEVQLQPARQAETDLYTGTLEEDPLVLQVRGDVALFSLGEDVSVFLLKEGVKLPQKPAYIAPPVTGKTNGISTLNFLESYPFWSGESVSYGYRLLPAAHRVFLKSFPSLRTDITWKVCQANRPSAGLFSLLERQGGDCPALLKGIETMQQRGKWPAFKKEVQQESEQMKLLVSCAQGMKHPNECKNISNIISNKNKLTMTIFDVIN